MKIAIQVIPILGWIIFLHVRAWNKTQAESFMDPLNWASIVIIGGWYVLTEYGGAYLKGLLWPKKNQSTKKKSKNS